METYGKLNELGTNIVEFPLTEDQIKARYTNVLWQSPFTPPDGYVKVTVGPVPTHTRLENLVNVEIILIDGQYTQVWAVVPATVEECRVRLAEMITTVKNNLSKEFNNRFFTNVPLIFPDGETQGVIQFRDLEDRINLTNLQQVCISNMLSGNPEESVGIWLEDNIKYHFSSTWLAQKIFDLFTVKQQLRDSYRAKKDAINLLSYETEWEINHTYNFLLQYDATTGWS